MEQAQSRESLNKDTHCNHDCTFVVIKSKKVATMQQKNTHKSSLCTTQYQYLVLSY